MSTAHTTQVTVPDIGDFDDVPVIEVLVSEGDTVSTEDPLVTLESDKATMDVPSPADGTVAKIHVKVGDSVSQGSLVLDLEGSAADDSQPSSDAAGPEDSGSQNSAPEPEDNESISGVGNSDSQPSSDASQTAPQAAPKSDSEPSGSSDAPVYASPSVRKLARELGVDLHGAQGTGRKGRLTGDDVRAAKADGGKPAAGGAPASGSAAGPDLGGLPAWPKVDFEKWGEIERVPRTRIQKISAPALARNWVMIPHVTQNDEADITDLEAWRKQLNSEQPKDSGVKFTMVTFLIAAVVATLKGFPDFNASLDGDDLVLRKYFNIGFAADTPGGLVVPVIKNADQKPLTDIAVELTELSGKARAGKLGPSDITGGTFSISSLGGIGGTSFTPIINAPEVAILGVSKSAMKPVWDASSATFVPRLMLPLSLSYDHRAIDGASAARFVAQLARVLGDLRRVLL
jgi:pyruvate dehydrogenase E2 component (dihydrolipoamide acetyltransferase)